MKRRGIEIAIVGMSCNFPGSPGYREFWQNLEAGKELVRHDHKQIYGLDTDRKYVSSRATMDEKEMFDNFFFGYRPDEAAMMDPQVRLFHEHCWAAIEDAGCSGLIANSKVGVFGSGSDNFNWRLYTMFRSRGQVVDSFYLNFINNEEYLASLVAYSLNLKGPGYYVATACSSALSAVHLACRSLLFRECNYALAGGVSIDTHKQKGYFYEEGTIFSEDGHCRSFDKASGGTVAGEGVGVVLLKRLDDALKDGDPVYAVIRSSAINNDGNNKVGFTTPSIQGQADCIRMAHKLADVDPADIVYVEAHGTGTKLGDPIEVAALNDAFGKGKPGSCAIGSVKSNIGHLDAASGMAALIKTVLVLKNKKIPASLFYTEPNPGIDWSSGPFYVNTSLKALQQHDDRPLLAGINSFGIGGTNVHLVLEEAPVENTSSPEPQFMLLPLSAKSEKSLQRYMEKLAGFLRTPGTNLADISYTLLCGRKHFDIRTSLVFESREELIGLLLDAKTAKAEKNSGVRESIFLFPGAGSQYANMGRGLYESMPVFREEMNKGFGILQKMTGTGYREIIYPDGAADDRISLALYAEPAIFLFGYSLAKLLISLGVAPAVTAGYGCGEYVCACLSGVFSFEDALKLAVKRGQLHELSGEAAIDVYRKELDTVKKNIPSLLFISSFTGKPVSREEALSDAYWTKHMRETLRSPDGLAQLPLSNDQRVFIGMGGGPSFAALLNEPLPGKTGPAGINLVRLREEEVSDEKYFIAKLGKLWSRGVDIDWNVFFKDGQRRRVSLPTYAFERNAFPVDVDPFEGYKTGEERHDDPDDWFYSLHWKQLPPVHMEVQEPAGKTILFFVADEPAEDLVASYAACDAKIIMVTAGNTYLKKDAASYIVDPAEEKHMDLLFADLMQSGILPSAIVHLWNYGNGEATGDETRHRHYLDKGYRSLLAVVRSFSMYFGVSPLQVNVIATGLYAVYENDTVEPSKATVLGAVRVIPKEFLSIQCRAIDITEMSEASCRELMTELNAPVTHPELAIRGRKKYARSIEKLAVKYKPSGPVFRKQGTYLITGASGAMGKIFSEYLAKEFNANLVLTARSAGQEQWHEELKAKGANVFFIQADVSDAAAIHEGIRQAEEKFGAIHGVLHTAGLVDFGGAIIRRTGEDDKIVFAPKIDGIRVLVSAFRNKPLDFFVNCSSVSASTAPFGEVAYVAASIYQDACAEAAAAYPVISIEWPTLKDAGAAVSAVAHLPAQQQEKFFRFAITPAAALEVLLRALYFRIPVPVISVVNFDVHLRSGAGENEEEQSAAHIRQRPELPNAYVAPSTPTEEKLIAMLGYFFGIEGVGVEDNFFELGGDSLKAMVFLKRTQKEFNVNLELKLFFTAPTVKQVAAEIDTLRFLLTRSKKSSRTVI